MGHKSGVHFSAGLGPAEWATRKLFLVTNSFYYSITNVSEENV